MTKADMLVELREILDETQRDPLWTPRTLERYLSEGQDVFCERTGFFKDTMNFSITTVIGQKNYALDGRIRTVLGVFRGDYELTHFHTGKYPTDNGNSAAVYWRADQDTGYITLWPTPNNVETLALRVHRYPLSELATKGVEPEIPRAFHRACIEYAAFRAFNHHDSEAQDKDAAATHLAVFEDYVTRGITYLHDLQMDVTGVAPSAAYVV